MQFAASKGRLKHVACIHGSIRLTCAHHGVQLVDKQDDVALVLPGHSTRPLGALRTRRDTWRLQ